MGALLVGVVAVALVPEVPLPGAVPAVSPALSGATFAVGASAVVAGLLNHLLVGGRDVPTDVAAGVYHAHATNGAAIVADRGLSDRRLYLPGDDEDPRLFVPADGRSDVADAAATEGATFTPTGAALYRTYERTRTSTPDGPGAALAHLCDAATYGLGLAATAEVLAVEDDRATVALGGSELPDVDRFDHPLPSLLGAGLAAELGAPVEVTTAPARDADAGEFVVTCRWDGGHDG
ncbi:MAG: hypothetical protein ABEJ70_03080 [Halobacteriaceae archaeon]